MVKTVTSDISQIIAFGREEELINDVHSRCFVWRFRVAKLPVDVYNGFLGRVAGIFLQGVVDNGIVSNIGIFFMQQYRRGSGIQDKVYMLFFQDGFAVENDLITFNGYNFSGIFVYEVFDPGFQNTRSQFSAQVLFKVNAVNLNFICQSKDLKDIFITLEPDSTEKGGHR